VRLSEAVQVHRTTSHERSPPTRRRSETPEPLVPGGTCDYVSVFMKRSTKHIISRPGGKTFLPLGIPRYNSNPP
jgi:hypothetical protein